MRFENVPWFTGQTDIPHQTPIHVSCYIDLKKNSIDTKVQKKYMNENENSNNKDSLTGIKFICNQQQKITKKKFNKTENI